MARAERTTAIVRTLGHGQITIPAAFRKRLGIDSETLLQMTLEDGELRIKPLRVAATATWLKELYERFASVREEASRYSEAEVDEAIDAAVAAARKRRA